MKRSVRGNGDVKHGNKSEKYNDGAEQHKNLNFQNHDALVIVDNGGVIWFSYADVTQTLDIPSVPSDVYDYCKCSKLIRKLSEVDVGPGSTPPSTLFIAAEGVRLVVCRSGKSKEKQFIGSILKRLYALSRENDLLQKRMEERINQLVEENERLKKDFAKRDVEKLLNEEKTENYKPAVYNLKDREPQVIYIATSDRYASENMFKVGGVKSWTKLKGRLATYNSGRTPNDFLYYCFWGSCSDYHLIEQRINTLVGKFRVKKKSEMYHLDFSIIKEVVEWLLERFNETDVKFNGKVDTSVRGTEELKSIIPPKLIVNGAEYRQQLAQVNVGVVERCDWNCLTADEQLIFVEDSFDNYINDELPSSSSGANSRISYLKRTDFEKYLSGLGVNFDKREMWKILKVVAKNRNISVEW